MKYYILVDPAGYPVSSIYSSKEELENLKKNIDLGNLFDLVAIDNLWKKLKYFWWFNEKVL